MALLDAFVHVPYLFVACALLFGLLVGSFLNVVIYRLPIIVQRAWRMECAESLNQPLSPEALGPAMTLWGPRSRCPHCDHLIGAMENIPIVSYILLRGRCAHCQAPISLQYPFVEMITGLSTAMVAWHFGVGWAALAAMVFTWTLIAASGIDFKHQLLFDVLTLPLLWLGLLLALFGTFTDLYSAVIGAMAGYLSLWTVYHVFRLVTGKEGMGYGDFKLLAALGAWVGWTQLLTVILISSAVGTIIGIGLILLRRHDRRRPMPFGPFLVVAGWIALLWGDVIARWYQRILL